MAQGVPLGAIRDGRGQLRSGQEGAMGRRLEAAAAGGEDAGAPSWEGTSLEQDPLSPDFLPKEMLQGGRPPSDSATKRRR